MKRFFVALLFCSALYSGDYQFSGTSAERQEKVVQYLTSEAPPFRGGTAPTSRGIGTEGALSLHAMGWPPRWSM
ncbi:hypothetical protein [Candidatus Neptunochlamydia vexilliferae]|uniref:Uncharacterized protein n=1 Tax=Candidatus Neptunichlamydia vexilliferae TaxID=1651774 RepID=A0ABS0AZJ0_9BACT|nr:hypothetical protein [Candidatus Neptunochlamydia vexilliferae]MBF5059558.1 hypothetical protein [Candidatus Neptunochlamydia vexilliferae]